MTTEIEIYKDKNWTVTMTGLTYGWIVGNLQGYIPVGDNFVLEGDIVCFDNPYLVPKKIKNAIYKHLHSKGLTPYNKVLW